MTQTVSTTSRAQCVFHKGQAQLAQTPRNQANGVKRSRHAREKVMRTTSVHVVPISAIKGDRIQQTNALQIH